MSETKRLTEKLSERMEKAYNNMSTFSYAWVEGVEALEAERDQLKEQCNSCQMHNPTLQVRRQRLTIANLEEKVKQLENDIVYTNQYWVTSKQYKVLEDRLAKAQADIMNYCRDDCEYFETCVDVGNNCVLVKWKNGGVAEE